MGLPRRSRFCYILIARDDPVFKSPGKQFEILGRQNCLSSMKSCSQERQLRE